MLRDIWADGAAGPAAALTPDKEPAPTVPSDEALLAAREEERRRLLFELHDCVGPTLVSVALGLRAARHALEANPEFAARLLVELEHDVRRGVAELRRLTKGDGEPTTGLRELGLLTALRRHVATLGSRTAGGLEIELDLPAELPPLPAAVEVAMYRVVCEALTNVIRHSHARSCVVRLWLDEDLHLEIVDDGTGLGPADTLGVGLRSMRQRASQLGGEFRAESVVSGRGTRVAVRLPCGSGGV
jgi:signal transduction histidine kinase